MGVLHIVVKEGVGEYKVLDSRSVASYTYVKGGYILEGRGRFWEGRI